MILDLTLNKAWDIRIVFISQLNLVWAMLFFLLLLCNFVGLIWLNPIKDHWQFNIIAIGSQDFPTLWTLNVIFLYIYSIMLNSPYAQVYTWVELVYSLRKLQQCIGDVIKARRSIKILSASEIPLFLLCAHKIIK